MKEISEINKRINDSAPVGQAQPAAEPEKKKWVGPNFRTTPTGGFQWVNPDLM